MTETDETAADERATGGPGTTPASESAGTTTVALVTGANKGIGFATARRLADKGWTVLLGSRDPDKGAAAAAELPGRDVSVVDLDVTSEDSVRAAAARVRGEHGRLDVLISNAGIGGPPVPPLQVGADEMRATYETNVFGPVRVMRAFVPLLGDSETPRVVLVSSGMGSIGVTSDPGRVESTIIGLPYPSSKTALNMITTQYAKALPRFRVNAVDPGYTATDLNGHSGPQSVLEGSDAIVALAEAGPDGSTGGFFDRHGPLPW